MFVDTIRSEDVRRAAGVVATVVALMSPAMAENWPGFRGPTRQGVSQEKDLPTQWTSEQNIAWHVSLPGRGWSSPIVWDDLVFITTATNAGADCHVMALDRRSGKLLWDTQVLRQKPDRKEGKNSYATPTPVTDGERVCAVFGDGSVVAVDFDGQLIWTNREVKHYSRHGLGASPILYKDRLIMAYDGSNRVAVPGDWPNNSDEERLGWQIPWDQAQIVALDIKTGERRWTARRGLSRVAHASPNIWQENGESQLVSTAGDVIQGFDPDTGKRLWTVESQGEGVVPSIVVGKGLLFTSSGFEASTIRTVRTGGEGNLTDTHIAWEQALGHRRNHRCSTSNRICTLSAITGSPPVTKQIRDALSGRIASEATIAPLPSTQTERSTRSRRQEKPSYSKPDRSSR